MAREAVAQAGGDEDVVGEGARCVSGKGGGEGEKVGLGGVEREEAGEEERVAGEAEGEREPVELDAESEVRAVEVEERGDGAEEEIGRGGGGEAAAEPGESEEREGEDAGGREGGEGG